MSNNIKITAFGMNHRDGQGRLTVLSIVDQVIIDDLVELIMKNSMSSHTGADDIPVGTLTSPDAPEDMPLGRVV